MSVGAGRSGVAHVSRYAATGWLLLSAALLSGCASLPELVPSERETATWRTHSRALARFQNWTMVGALVVRTAGEATRVAVRWRQARTTYRVRFSALLGAGLFELEGSETTVEARFADGRRIQAESPETLLEQEVGWSVPLDGLRYWLVGTPAPGETATAMELDDRGRLARLEQAGWTVIYEEYGDLDGLSLPERIRFSSEAIDATVVVRRWKAEHVSASTRESVRFAR